MENCPFTKQLGIYYDNELSDSEMSEFEQHLRSCDDCQQQLEQLEKLSLLIKPAANTPLPPAVTDRLHTKIDHYSTSVIRNMARIMTSIAATILITCSVLLWQKWNSGNQYKPAPQWEQSMSEMMPHSKEDLDLGEWMMESLAKNDRD